MDQVTTGNVTKFERPCSRCGTVLPWDAFPVNRSTGGRADGRHSQCVECKRQSARESNLRHAETNRARTARWWASLREEMFQHYGEECACCGEQRREFLCIDHINGGGNRHRAEVAGTGSVFYAWLRRNGWPEGFRTLCHNCNQARGLYGHCPHEQEIREVAANG